MVLLTAVSVSLSKSHPWKRPDGSLDSPRTEKQNTLRLKTMQNLTELDNIFYICNVSQIGVVEKFVYLCICIAGVFVYGMV